MGIDQKTLFYTLKVIDQHVEVFANDMAEHLPLFQLGPALGVDHFEAAICFLHSAASKRPLPLDVAFFISSKRYSTS